MLCSKFLLSKFYFRISIKYSGDKGCSRSFFVCPNNKFSYKSTSLFISIDLTLPILLMWHVIYLNKNMSIEFIFTQGFSPKFLTFSSEVLKYSRHSSDGNCQTVLYCTSGAPILKLSISIYTTDAVCYTLI